MILLRHTVLINLYLCWLHRRQRMSLLELNFPGWRRQAPSHKSAFWDEIIPSGLTQTVYVPGFC